MRKRKRGKGKRLLCVCVAVCLVTALILLVPQSLHTTLPPSLAQLKLRQFNSPSPRISPTEPTIAGCGHLFQKSALRRDRYPVTATASGWARHYCTKIQTLQEKGGLRRPPLRAGDSHNTDTDTELTSGGWDTDLLQPFLLFPAGNWIYTYFLGTFSFPSFWFGNWLWIVNQSC